MGHAPSDSPGICARGVGKQNVQCLFMTPQGNLFHAASGFRNAEDLLEELQFALTTFRSMQKRPSLAAKIVRDAHVQRMQRQGFDEAEISQPPSPFGSVNNLIASMQGNRQSNRNGQRPFNVANVFEAKTRASDLADGQFAVHHPLMPIKEFLSDPRVLVGHEKTAFSSVGNGGSSGIRLGN